jgi:acyl transferase domain-containing protein
MSGRESSRREPIAIVGLAGRFPGAASLDDFWRNLRQGVDSLATFSDAELAAAGVDEQLRSRTDWVPRGTLLEDAEMFDASFFGYSPREAQIIDPQHRAFLECAWEALEHAGYASEMPGTTVGVYAGTSLNSYVMTQLLADRALTASVGGYQLMLGNDKDFLCTRVSYKLDLHGPSLSIQTACSTSLVAVQIACRALQRGDCDMALAGGVSISFPQRSGYQYQDGMIFSPDGTCRPFDSEARGTRAGAGAGIVVLKRLADAVADRDTIHAVILGAAINNDGAGKAGYTAPSVEGQVEVIATALALADVDPRSISYVEAHGTGTPLGDPIEIAALTRAFRASTPDTGFCAIGSLKANLGHLDAAAGVAGLIKTVLALEHREIPPLVHFRSPNPQLDLLASPFRVPTSAEDWLAGASPRRAGVSSFGIGGTNAHVIVEEAPTPPASVTHRPQHVLVLSARSAAALDAATARLVDHLRAQPGLALADVAYTLQVGRREFRHRRSVVAADATAAIELLSHPDRPPVQTAVHDGAGRPVAFLFSGQGSQHAGMCRELYCDEPAFRTAFDRCADHLQPVLVRGLRDLLLDGSDTQLSETASTQPLLFAVEYALAQLWMAWGVRPAAMLGHSIGEYVAAHLAGVFSLEDALTVVAARGRLMQALPAGDMLSVSLSLDDVAQWLVEGVEIAAVNAPGLCTLSGPHEAIAALEGALTTAGIEHRRLHTSHAFHSAMMEPALAPLRAIVAGMTLAAPTVPYISNVTGTWITAAQSTSPDYYAEHLRRAVLFADGVATLTADASRLVLEVGPGTVLATLARQTVGRDGAARVLASQPHPRESRAQIDALLMTVARLWTGGASLNWDGMHRQEQLRRVPLPTYPFERKRYWVDAPAAAATTAAMPVRHADVADWFHRPTWTHIPAPRTGRSALTGTWLVFGHRDALMRQVVDQMRNAGTTPIAVTPDDAFVAIDAAHYSVRVTETDDYIQLLRELRTRELLPAGVLHLWNVGAAATGDADATRPLHELTALGRALMTETPSASLRLLIATSDAQSVLGEAVANPERALVTGAVLVLPQEHDTLKVRALDIETGGTDWAERAGAAIISEATIDDGESFVALRAGRRWAKRFERTPLPPAARHDLPLRHRGIYLITGGLGGIGVTLAEWLAARVSARLVLTTRSTLPPRDEWNAWLSAHSENDAVAEHILRVRRIEAAGAEVRVVTADLADVTTMRRVLDAVREQWGDVDGVVHAAGVKRDALMAMSTPADDELMLQPKVGGTLALRTLFASTPLDFVVLCSSVSAAVGFAGTTAYAAANAFLDAFVVSSQCPAAWGAISIAWDSWRDVGMAIKLRGARGRLSEPEDARAAEAGIRPDDGAESFARALASGLSQHIVSPYDVAAVDAHRRSQARVPATSGAAAAADAAPVAPTADAMSPGAVEHELMLIWQELLGINTVRLDENFFELGGHSLLATRILARVDRTFGIRLPLRTVFEAPTIRELAALIAVSGQAPVVTVSGDREEFEL